MRAFTSVMVLLTLSMACKGRQPEAALKDEPGTSGGAIPADCDPGRVIDATLALVNERAPISALIPRLLAMGVQLDAVQSPSAQRSRSNADPRIIARSGCALFTFTLLGKSLELGVQEQVATLRLPGPTEKNPETIDPAAPPALNGGITPDEVGEILVDIKDPTAGDAVASKVVSHWDPAKPRKDSNRCSTCHLDLKNLQLGQKIVTAGGTSFLALVNPLAANGDRTTGYCIPGDLHKIRACVCGGGGGERPAGCETLNEPLPDAEGCARLEALLALSPRALGIFPPEKHEAGSDVCL